MLKLDLASLESGPKQTVKVVAESAATQATTSVSPLDLRLTILTLVGLADEVVY